MAKAVNASVLNSDLLQVRVLLRVQIREGISPLSLNYYTLLKAGTTNTDLMDDIGLTNA